MTRAPPCPPVSHFAVACTGLSDGDFDTGNGVSPEIRCAPLDSKSLGRIGTHAPRPPAATSPTLRVGMSGGPLVPVGGERPDTAAVLHCPGFSGRAGALRSGCRRGGSCSTRMRASRGLAGGPRGVAGPLQVVRLGGRGRGGDAGWWTTSRGTARGSRGQQGRAWPADRYPRRAAGCAGCASCASPRHRAARRAVLLLRAPRCTVKCTRPRRCTRAVHGLHAAAPTRARGRCCRPDAPHGALHRCDNGESSSSRHGASLGRGHGGLYSVRAVSHWTRRRT